MRQLQNPTYIIPAGLPNAGDPDLPALLTVFEEIWHNKYDQGVEIKYQAAPKLAPNAPSNRVDGMYNGIVTDVDPDDFEAQMNISEANLNRFASAPRKGYVPNASNFQGSNSRPPAFDFVNTIGRNCNKCHGFGHIRIDCPSDETSRPLSQCIDALQSIQKANYDRLGSMKTTRKIIRRPGNRPRPGARVASILEEQPIREEVVYQYDDGSIVSESGEVLFESVSNPSNVESNQVASIPNVPPQIPVSEVPNSAPQAQSAESHIAVPPDVSNTETIDDRIENDFISSFSSFSCAAREEMKNEDPFVWKETKSIASKTAKFATAAVALLAVGVAAARSTRGKGAMMMLGLFSSASGLVLPTISSTTRVHSSNFAQSNFDTSFAHKSTSVSDPMHTSRRQHRQHGIMDTGTTEHTSGRKSLFDMSAVEQWHPNVKVEIANGITEPVLFRGVMIIKIPKEHCTSTKKTTTIRLAHALCVPGLPVTLLSSKAMLRNEGIRCYFNDELSMVLPNGDLMHFVETATNYTLIFDGDDDVVIALRTSRFTEDADCLTSFAKYISSMDGRKDAFSLRMTTLKEPLPMCWDLAHSRCTHFAPEKILASEQYVTGLDFNKLRTKIEKPCLNCVKGSFRGHRHGKREKANIAGHFGQVMFLDSCAMPRSTPFGFIEMYIFYDQFTKYIAVYFGKNPPNSEEMVNICKQHQTDYSQWLPKGFVECYYADGGPEFKGKMEEFCREMGTRRKFIVPWNPWMNVAETGWRIILRPLRIIMAQSNVTRRLWPFGVQQLVFVYNALSSASETGEVSSTNLTQAFMVSIGKSTPNPSPYFVLRQKPCDLQHLRVIFCECYCIVRNKDDITKRGITHKLEDRAVRALHLGLDTKRSGYLIYLFDAQRFTTSSYNDTYFLEDKFPALDHMVGSYNFQGMEGLLPTEEQQMAAIDEYSFPEFDDTHLTRMPAAAPSAPPALPPIPPNTNDADPETVDFRNTDDRCRHPHCTFHSNHHGLHSFERVTNSGLPSRNTRSAIRNAHIAAALEGDTTGIFEAALFSSVHVAQSDEIAICYNTEITEYGHDPQLPKNERAALNGPEKDTWLAAFRKDLLAKVANKTFSLVPRPKNKRVLPTKVALAYKRCPKTNAILEYRARWVGLGCCMRQGDFKETYTATPTATSVRLFLTMLLALTLFLFQGDVTKAFTLNPIDVELYCEQMYGMEARGANGEDPKDTVCLLHKCLEGLKQAGHIWQTTHSKAILSFIIRSSRFTQSDVEPCLFVLHCSTGILILLVWIDDLLVGASSRELYEEFKALYVARFPSTHSDVVNKFAGLSIDYKRGVSLTIHQIGHIELAFEKFIIDKVAARKSPAVSRPAVADRASRFHYSNIHLAANDEERKKMKDVPYLACLATLMYVAQFSLAYLVYYTAYLGQFMHDPSPAAWEAVLELLVYAYYSRHQNIIVYSPKFGIPPSIPEKHHAAFTNFYGLHAYSDASWLLRSMAGFVVMMLGGPVDWGSKLIRVICHSSSEAEISAGCMLGKRTVFINQFFGDILNKATGYKFLLLIDNTAAIDLTKKVGVGARTAHFLRWQHYLRWLVQHGYVHIVFVGTKEQLADMFTKVVDVSTFNRFMDMIFARRLSFKTLA